MKVCSFLGVHPHYNNLVYHNITTSQSLLQLLFLFTTAIAHLLHQYSCDFDCWWNASARASACLFWNSLHSKCVKNNKCRSFQISLWVWSSYVCPNMGRFAVHNHSRNSHWYLYCVFQSLFDDYSFPQMLSKRSSVGSVIFHLRKNCKEMALVFRPQKPITKSKVKGKLWRRNKSIWGCPCLVTEPFLYRLFGHSAGQWSRIISLLYCCDG